MAQMVRPLKAQKQPAENTPGEHLPPRAEQNGVIFGSLGIDADEFYPLDILKMFG